MTDQDEARALSVGLSFQELGRCVDVAINVNDISFQMPGLVWRAEWENALESLASTEACAVLDRVLDIFSARLSYLRHLTVREPPESRSDGSEYKRFTPEDLDNLKGLLVLAERSSVQALASSDASVQGEACHHLEHSMRQLQLCRALLYHLRATLQSWLCQGQGEHGAAAALSNPDIVQSIFEAIESSTITPWHRPPDWLQLAGVSRLWRDTVRAFGRCVFLSRNAAPEVVNGALQQLPTMRRLRCNLSHLNIHGAGGLISLLDLLEGATTLEVLQIDRWIQCSKPTGAERMVTMPRLRYFNLFSLRATQSRRSDNNTSLLRYLRLPAVEQIVVCEDTEINSHAPAPPAALAAHLSGIAGALTSTSPCLQNIQQFIIDSLPDGLSIRGRRSKGPLYRETPSNTPMTIRICSIPRSDVSATHLFIRFCQLLASLRVEEQPVQLDTLAIATALGPYGPDDENALRRDPFKLPLYNFDYHSMQPEPDVILFVLRDAAALNGVRALDVQLLPVAGLPIGPAMVNVVFDSRISREIVRRDGILQAPQFFHLLRERATRGFRIHSMIFTGMPPDIQVPARLGVAAQSWGDHVSLQNRQTGKALVFQPL
ncbi:hypothetical protein PENSPDRAFT_751947 [Peniophora sp. CONT]|nr:hypothetical protein PENSPDRAFT_751947 [Peniophora sp. CONT]